MKTKEMGLGTNYVEAVKKTWVGRWSGGYKAGTDDHVGS